MPATSAIAVKKYKHAGNEDEFLAELRERYAYGLQADSYNRDQGDEDMRALSVDGNWPSAEWAARGGSTDGKTPPRPRGHYDICSQFPNRVVNQQRMNKRGVKVTPTGDGASTETAERLEGRIREIEYASKANSARLNALQQAAERGEGVWRVDIEFVSQRSRAKKITIKRVPNVKSIVGDPDTKETDRSDRKWLFAIEPMTVKHFKADPRFAGARDPDEAIQSFPVGDASGLAMARNWYNGGGKILIAEYWVVEKLPVRVLFVEGQGDSGIFEDELPEGWKLSGKSIVHEKSGTAKTLEDTRDSYRSKVYSYFTNGFDVFSRSEWPGSTIPFPTVVGREKFEPRVGQDGDMPTKESITRKLREPQLAYDVLKANMQESLLMAPKSKWQMDDETLGPYEDMYASAHRNPQAFLLYKKYDSQGQKNERPERSDFDATNITYLDQVGRSYIMDSQNAVGMTTTERVVREAASGVAQQELNATADVASFHIVDSWTSAIEFEYRITEELLRIVEDSERTVGIRKADGSYTSEKLTPKADPETGEIVEHPYGPPDAHTVTISVGRDWQSQHQEDNDNIQQMSKRPEFSVPLGPLLVDAMEMGPRGDLMKKVLEAVLPPAVKAVYDEGKPNAKPPTPPEALSVIQAGQQKIQLLESELAAANQEIEAKKAQSDSSEKIAAIKAETDIAVARIQQETKTGVSLFEGHLQALQHTLDLMMGQMKMQHDATMQDSTQQHQTGLQQSAQDAAAQQQREAAAAKGVE